MRKVLESTPDLAGTDDSVTAEGSKTILHKGLAGEDLTPVHNTESEFEIPVRVTLPAEKQSSLDALLAAARAFEPAATRCRSPNSSR